MPALILIVPLIAAWFDQGPKVNLCQDNKPAVTRSYDLPPNTEVIYFVSN